MIFVFLLIIKLLWFLLNGWYVVFGFGFNDKVLLVVKLVSDILVIGVFVLLVIIVLVFLCLIILNVLLIEFVVVV